MNFCSEIEYDNRVWGYIWVNPALGLEESIKNDLAWQIIDMYHGGDDIRHIEKENYGAKIVKKGRKNLGMFIGDYFNAEFETDKLKSRLSIILLDVIDHRAN